MAFFIAVVVRTAHGSATVALITASGILSGMASNANLSFHPVYLGLAIGCGSKLVPWMNDAGFWIICKSVSYTHLDVYKRQPQGYDNTTISTAVAAKKLASLWDYSQLDRTRMGGLTAPSFLVTYAQTQLLLAEAVYRKWTTGDAATLYANGIKANMQQYAGYGTSSAIADAAIDTYCLLYTSRCV